MQIQNDIDNMQPEGMAIDQSNLRKEWDPEESITLETIAAPSLVGPGKIYASTQGEDHRLCISCGALPSRYCYQCKASFCSKCDKDPSLSGVAHAKIHSSQQTTRPVLMSSYCQQHNLVSVFARKLKRF
jgi:hypothetical protein